LKTTAKTLTGLIVVASCLMPTLTQAGPNWFMPQSGMCQMLTAQAPSTNPQATPRQQANDLLNRARQAMSENRLDVAEQLISQAEKLGVRYNPFNRLTYTPAKARGELKRIKSASKGNTTLAALAKSLPFGSKTPAPVPADPFLANQQQMPVASNTNQLLAARKALAMGDVRRASELVGQLKSTNASFPADGDSPEKIQASIEKYQIHMSQAPTHKNSEGYRRQFAKLMIEQSEGLLLLGDYDTAERLIFQAKDQRVMFSPLEPNPDAMLERITSARRNAASPKAKVSNNGDAKNRVNKLLSHAQAALGQGDLDAAEAYTRVAAGITLTVGSIPAGQINPNSMMQEIQKRRASSSNVALASHQTAGSTQNSQANQFAVDAPQLGNPQGVRLTQNIAAPRAASTGQAMTFFQQGEAALQAKKIGDALRLYKQANQYRAQLDAQTAARLDKRLKLLSTPGIGSSSSVATTAPESIPIPLPSTSTLPQQQTQQQQLLARQLLNDLAQAEKKSNVVRETDPNAAITSIETIRTQINSASLDPVAKATLIRRANRDLATLSQFVKDNEARLSLNRQNKEILEQVERERQHTLEVRQKLAQVIELYNQKVDEHSFAEAQVLAKQAYDLAPEEPVARQVWDQAKFLRRFTNNMILADNKEQGFVDTMASVDNASIPFDDREPYRFPDAKVWDSLSKRRGQLMSEQRGVRNEREIEIEQKLKTPVSLSFSNQPLSAVLDHLAKIAQINIHLDPEGFSEENVSTDMPVTINLQSEISLKSALNLILSPYQLDYVIQDEVLKITSENNSDQEVYIVSYPVADLVVPIPNFGPNPNMGLGGAYSEAMRRNGFGGSGGFGGAAPPLGVLSDNSNTTISDTVLAQTAGSSGGMSSGGSGAMGFGPGGAGGGANADFDSLIELITTTITPESWAEMGGTGSVEPFEANMTLVISQTQEVHENIVDLFKQLRRLQDLQVTIEVRFITLNDNFFERIGVDFDFDINDGVDGFASKFGSLVNSSSSSSDDEDSDNEDVQNEPLRDLRDQDADKSVTVGMAAPGVFSADLDIPFRQGSFGLAVPQFGGYDAAAGASMGFAILSDIEAYFFIEAAQGDKRTNVLQAPKVTLFNGQMAFIQDMSMSPFVMSLMPVVGDFAAAQQPIIVILAEGTSLTVQAVVSSDRRFVRLTIVPYFSQIGDVNTFTFSGETTSTSDTSTEGDIAVGQEDNRENNIQTQSSQGTTVQLPTFSVISVSTTVSVPDGGTVLLGGIKRLSEGRNEFGTPMLNKIPYLSRLFKNVGIGRETQSLMMMVTPRIIIQEEEEERITGGPGS
jgi:general secretion pathway protein D